MGEMGRVGKGEGTSVSPSTGSPGSLLEMQIPEPHPRALAAESLHVGP